MGQTIYRYTYLRPRTTPLLLYLRLTLLKEAREEAPEEVSP